MPAMTARDKRVVRLATAGVAVYLVLFFGAGAAQSFSKKRAGYLQLTQDARNLKQELQPYQDKALAIQRWMEQYQLDPARLSRATVVAEASAAIQKSGLTGGIQFGPIRESAAPGSGKEMASMQIEGTGPPPAVLALLHRLQGLGFPLVLDQVQITLEPMKPGMVKLNLTIIILDYDQWQKKEERPNA